MSVKPSIARSAAALLIGNELLSGKTREANLFELAGTLRQVGVHLRRVAIVGDEIDIIARELRALCATHDVVFTSGGIGPTHDDVTIEAVATAFGVGVRTDPTMKSLLERVYGARMTDGHLRMALVPDGARLEATDEVPWPTVVMGNVWVLPGVPEIFRMKLAVVRERIRGGDPFVSRAVYTKMDEGELKAILDALVASEPSVEIGSYPKFFDPTYKTKVTFDSRSQAAVDRAVERFLAALPAGEPQSLG